MLESSLSLVFCALFFFRTSEVPTIIEFFIQSQYLSHPCAVSVVFGDNSPLFFLSVASSDPGRSIFLLFWAVILACFCPTAFRSLRGLRVVLALVAFPSNDFFFLFLFARGGTSLLSLGFISSFSWAGSFYLRRRSFAAASELLPLLWLALLVLIFFLSSGIYSRLFRSYRLSEYYQKALLTPYWLTHLCCVFSGRKFHPYAGVFFISFLLNSRAFCSRVQRSPLPMAVCFPLFSFLYWLQECFWFTAFMSRHLRAFLFPLWIETSLAFPFLTPPPPALAINLCFVYAVVFFSFSKPF